MSQSIKYQLHVDNPNAHLLAIGVEIPLAGAATDDGGLMALMPSWTPGSYLMREYARFVQDVQATDERGNPLAVRKVEKHRWHITVPTDRAIDAVHLNYRVYGYDLSVRAVHVDSSHAFINGPAAFMAIEGMMDRPCELSVTAPDPAWKIFTSLRRADGQTGTPTGSATFAAPDYTELVDRPLELGPHEEHTFTAAGVEHRVVFWGDHRAPIDRLLPDMAKIVEAAAGLFDGLPYDTYLFIVLGDKTARGGLEHKDSTALQFPLRGYDTKKGYEDFLALVAHEHFHVWNVKRIRPEVLGPFDYAREAYTRALWIMEGVTCHYENVVLLKAGLMTPERYLELLAERYAQLQATPGRRLQSLEESSFDAWIKLYRPDPSNTNTTVSYYLKGELVACLLDLDLRYRSGGERSLHDIMTDLWRRYRERDAGFPEEGFQALAEGVVELGLGEFFDRFVRGTDELPLADALAHVGLILAPKDCEEAVKPYLGVTLSRNGSRVDVDKVYADSPAERGGLYVGDEIVAIDGFQVTCESFNDQLAHFEPSETVTFHLFRRGVLTSVDVTLGVSPPDGYQITVDPAASDTARALREAWIGHMEARP